MRGDHFLKVNLPLIILLIQTDGTVKDWFNNNQEYIHNILIECI